MGRSPVQIDIVNQANGIHFEDCYKRRRKEKVGDLFISLISKEDLIKNKKALGRYQDLVDIEYFADCKKEKRKEARGRRKARLPLRINYD